MSGEGTKPWIDFEKVLTEKAASLTSRLDAGGSVLAAVDKLSKGEGGYRVSTDQPWVVP